MPAGTKSGRSTAALRPGIHPGIPPGRYYADPCEKPSLTASIAKVLCDRSPLHAWWAHPRLNPDYEREEAAKFDLGTAAHAMLLQGIDACMPVDAPDWRTKVAKEQRDEIRNWGRIPLLTEQWERVTELVESVKFELGQFDPPALTDGKPEQTLVWKEQGVICRGRMDWLRDDLTVFEDLKTTARDAQPLSWTSRRLWDLGLDVQAAFYQRGLKHLTGKDVEPRFLLVESTPPYAVSVLGLAPSALELAHEKVQWAIDTWRKCVATDTWPGYPRQIAYAELPAWQALKWAEERYLEGEAA